MDRLDGSEHEHAHALGKGVWPTDLHFLSVLLQIDNIQLMMDSETGRSKGYGFITVSGQSGGPHFLRDL